MDVQMQRYVHSFLNQRELGNSVFLFFTPPTQTALSRVNPPASNFSLTRLLQNALLAAYSTYTLVTSNLVQSISTGAWSSGKTAAHLSSTMYTPAIRPGIGSFPLGGTAGAHAGVKIDEWASKDWGIRQGVAEDWRFNSFRVHSTPFFSFWSSPDDFYILLDIDKNDNLWIYILFWLPHFA
jgi:hypothetical protein